MSRHGPDPESRNDHALRTERLTIEVPDAADAPVIFALVSGENRQRVCTSLAWDGPDKLRDIEGWIQKCRTLPFKEWGYHWIIRDGQGAICGTPNRAIGAIGTRPLAERGRADVGYWLGADYWGDGIMLEALTAVVELGFSKLSYAKIEAEVFVSNTRGCRLVERVGFQREGTRRRAQRKNGAWVDVALYGVISQDEG